MNPLRFLVPALLVTASACAAPPADDADEGAAAQSTARARSSMIVSRYSGTIRDLERNPMAGVTLEVGCPTLGSPEIEASSTTTSTGEYELVLESPRVVTCEGRLARGARTSPKFLIIAGPPTMRIDATVSSDLSRIEKGWPLF